ncbi:MAG: DUF1673 family protein [Methanosarcinaceae archaeon]|nr:DUF1673 family protein [Methanosarcinaceae archaeon]
MTINVAETVRKLMGWCPNASTIKYKESMHFDAPQMNAPDIGSGSIHAVNGWLNIYRNRVLSISVILTLMAIGFFITAGMYDLDMFLTGVIAGLLSSFATWFSEWRRLNKAAAGKFVSQKLTLKRKEVQLLVLISLIALVSFFIGFLAWKSNTDIQGVFAFVSGLALPVWTQYFEVIYWERKNGKTLIVDKTSFYAVDAPIGK